MSRAQSVKSSAPGCFSWVSACSLGNTIDGFMWYSVVSRDTEYIPLSECYVVWSQILVL